jgi:hypothetical protein
VFAASVTRAHKTGMFVRDVFGQWEPLAEMPRQREDLVRPAACIGTQ